MTEKRAQIILKVAQAIGTQLEMSELLASLNEALKPIVQFDGIAIVILEGEKVNVHWAHLEGLARDAGETLESVMGRYARGVKVDPPPMSMPVSNHPISQIMKSGEAYVASDLEAERGFDTDEPLLNAGFRSYIDLPLVKQGQLVGTIKFLSREKGNCTGAQVGLLQDISNIVAIAASNALAYEEKVIEEAMFVRRC